MIFTSNKQYAHLNFIAYITLTSTLWVAACTLLVAAVVRARLDIERGVGGLAFVSGIAISNKGI